MTGLGKLAMPLMPLAVLGCGPSLDPPLGWCQVVRSPEPDAALQVGDQVRVTTRTLELHGKKRGALLTVTYHFVVEEPSDCAVETDYTIWATQAGVEAAEVRWSEQGSGDLTLTIPRSGGQDTWVCAEQGDTLLCTTEDGRSETWERSGNSEGSRACVGRGW